jgi:hypothetical protein
MLGGIVVTVVYCEFYTDLRTLSAPSHGGVAHEVSKLPPSPPPPPPASRSRSALPITEKAWSLEDWDETLAVDKTRFTMFNGMGHCGMCKGVGNNVVG